MRQNLLLVFEDNFFFKNYLDENLVKDLPIPSGNILYKESYGFSSPTVYVKSSLKADEYAREVLDYLIQNNYKYIYAVEKIYVRYGLAPTKEKAYLVKEFSSLDDCYFEGEESWFLYLEMIKKYMLMNLVRMVGALLLIAN